MNADVVVGGGLTKTEGLLEVEKVASRGERTLVCMRNAMGGGVDVKGVTKFGEVRERRIEVAR